MCLAEFAACYYKDYKLLGDDTNDAQPDVLTDTVAESQHACIDSTATFPSKIKLLNTKEIIRFHMPNKKKEPEKFFHHLFMLYTPWRDELAELVGRSRDNTYASKFYEPEVQIIVQRNRMKFEPDVEAVDEALEFLRNS